MLPIILDAAIRSAILVVAVFLGLRLFRITNPHIQMAAWQMVLAISLLMPFLIEWTAFTLPPAILPIPRTMSAGPILSFAPISGQVLPKASPRSVDWRAVCSWLYFLVAGLLALRLLVGIALACKLCWSARPIREDWTSGRDVRVNGSVNTPVTFGSTILLPAAYIGWAAVKRRAVMAHESAHVSRGDFYVSVLAAINRAVFWFSPMAWWLNSQIAYLAEARSDAAAIEDIDDRLRYAEILLDLGSNASRSSAILAMAGPHTVHHRVEHILAETILPSKMGWKRWLAMAACILPVAIIAAGAIAQVSTSSQENKPVTLNSETVARLREEQAKPRKEIQVDPSIFDNYTGYYELAPGAIFTVRRIGDGLFIELTGQPSYQVYPESTRKFFYKVVPAQISFITDAQGQATELVLHQDGFERPAKRIDQSEAQRAADILAEKIREGTPTPGSEAALRHQIEAMIRGQGKPDYGEMTEELAAVSRPQVPNLWATLEALGPLESITFRGVGLQGWDIYEVKFANGTSIWRIMLSEDGKVSGLLFQAGP
jgi:beta-lactamase regulating signal transducer with metallopeptidase domain